MEQFLTEEIYKRMDQYLKENLSIKTKEVQLVNLKLEKILRKSWERPSFFTMEDWYEATHLVDRLNKLCKGDEL